MRVIRFLGCCLLAMTATGPAAEARDGRLRERIRERLQERGAGAPSHVVFPDGPIGPIRAPGTYRYELRHDGAQREYLVHVPRSYDAHRPTPVLFAFHGGGGHMERQADDRIFGLVSRSEQAGFIAVFPNGTGVLPGGRLATWNAGACCAGARDRGIDDVGFVRRVHADVAARLRIDASRVYATGMSNGGMMAYRLACEASDLFRAIAAVAGTDATRACTPAQPVAVLHIHARDDTHVLFDGGAGPDAFRDASKVTDFISVADTVVRWVSRNRCSLPPRRVLERPGATCDLHAPCAGGGDVQVCITEAGGHTWPGGGAVRGRTPTEALSANDVMWDFFSSLPPRAAR